MADSGVREFVSRIHELTPECEYDRAVDGGVATNYLDRKFDRAEFATFETRCAKTNATLAELTDTHQVLNVTGEKVQVPQTSKPGKNLFAASRK